MRVSTAAPREQADRVHDRAAPIIGPVFPRAVSPKSWGGIRQGPEGLLTTRTSVLLWVVRWLAHPTSPRHSRRSRPAGDRPRPAGGASSRGWSRGPLRGRRCRWTTRSTQPQAPPRRTPSRPRHCPSPSRQVPPAPGSRPPTPRGGSSPRALPRWTPSWARAVCRALPPWPCEGRHRRAKQPSPSGLPQRRRQAGRSWRGWTSPARSTRSRPSAAGSGRSGWWSSRPRTSRRHSRSRAPCSPRGRWTCWSWTCPTDVTRRWPASWWGTGWGGCPRSLGGPGRCSWSWSRTRSAGRLPQRSRRPAGCGWGCAARAGSGWAGTWSASGARLPWSGTVTGRRAAARSWRSCTRRVGRETPASVARSSSPGSPAPWRRRGSASWFRPL